MLPESSSTCLEDSRYNGLLLGFMNAVMEYVLHSDPMPTASGRCMAPGQLDTVSCVCGQMEEES
jgi:hypothetical protein